MHYLIGLKARHTVPSQVYGLLAMIADYSIA